MDKNLDLIQSQKVTHVSVIGAYEASEIRILLCNIGESLATIRYFDNELPADIINNTAFARADMNMNIYNQTF